MNTDGSTLGCARDFPKLIKHNFFQSLDFRRVLESIGWETIYFESETGRHHASVLAFPQPFSPDGIPVYAVYSRIFPSYRVFFGPCIRPFSMDADPEVLDSPLKGLCAAARHRGAFHLEVRTPFPSAYGSEVFRRNGFARTHFRGVSIRYTSILRRIWKLSGKK
jgi:hypothetical protein